MRRFAKILSIAATVFAVLIVIGCWALNRWLRSPDAQIGMRHDLSRALGMALQIEKLDFSIWSGLRAEGVSASDRDGNHFEAATISASHRLFPLLRRRIALAEVRVEKPLLHLVQNASGAWTMPAAPEEIHAASNITPDNKASAERKVKPRSEVVINQIFMSDATIELMDKDRAPFATITGLNATLHDAIGKNFAGEFDAAGLVLHQWARLENVKGTISRSDGARSLGIVAADIGGGHATGQFTQLEGKPDSMRVALDGVNIERATSGAGANAPRFTGVVSGEGVIAGIGGDKNAVTGSGTFNLKNGDCREIELLRQVGEILQLDTLGDFEIADAGAVFQIGAGRISFSPLDISAPPLGLSLTGSVGFDDTLALAATLSVPADFIEKRGAIAAQFSPPNANHRRGVQFDVKGTLKKPKQNLAERVTGTKDRTMQKIIAAEAIISAITGKKKGKPKVEPPKLEAAPIPTQP